MFGVMTRFKLMMDTYSPISMPLVVVVAISRALLPFHPLFIIQFVIIHLVVLNMKSSSQIKTTAWPLGRSKLDHLDHVLEDFASTRVKPLFHDGVAPCPWILHPVCAQEHGI